MVYTLFLYQGNFAGSRKMIEDAASHLRAMRTPPQGPVYKDWFPSWLKDHPELRCHRFKPVEIKRRLFELNEESVLEFFDRYTTLIKEKNIKQADTWNVDEAGVLIGMMAKSGLAVVSLRELWNRYVGASLYPFFPLSNRKLA